MGEKNVARTPYQRAHPGAVEWNQKEFMEIVSGIRKSLKQSLKESIEP